MLLDLSQSVQGLFDGLSSARQQNMGTADSGWKLMLLNLDFLISFVMFKMAAENYILTTCTPAELGSSSA